MQRVHSFRIPRRIVVALVMFTLAVLFSLLSRFFHSDVPQDAPTPSVMTYGQVIGVIDGDTLDIAAEGKTMRVRLRGIDAPEKAQLWGDESLQMLKGFLGDSTVCLSLYGQDRFGRELAELSVDGRIPASVSKMPCSVSINQLMVKNGGAWAYRYQGKAIDKDLLPFENKARSSRAGLWVTDDPTPPWQWRAQNNFGENDDRSTN